MLRRLVPIALLCLPVACATGTGRGSGNDAGVACASNADCPGTYVCTQGVCTAKGATTSCKKGSCPAHQFCGRDGTCHGSGQLACQSSADCGGGFTCDPNTHLCVQSCVVSGDCASNEVCNPALKYCAECSFDTDCQTSPSRPHCNQKTGQCVQCLVAGECPAGQYCATSATAAKPDTCQPGCLTDSDCSVSTHCDRPGTDPGRCVQCTVSSELQDCTDPAKPVCDPSTQMCVQCVTSGQCSGNKNATVCDSKTQSCVECLDDTTCNMGQVCVGASDTCAAGCVDTTGGPPTPNAKRCPPPGASNSQDTLCDPNMGPHGTCVECVHDGDCNAGYLCDSTTGQCVPGCKSSATCPAKLPVCDLLANNGQGRCVQCRSNGDCTKFSSAGNLHCDLTQGDATYEQCVCLSQGDRCTASANCGNPPNRDYTCGPSWCVAQVGCPTSPSCTSGNCLNWVKMPTDVCGKLCSDPAGGSGCASGYVCRYVRNEQQLQGAHCVPSNACP